MSHIHEEHELPQQDPLRFAHGSLAISLGLDSQGNHNQGQKPSAQDPQQQPPTSAPAMSVSNSKQGQTSMKVERGAIPMTREASMTRQGSSAGVKACENSKATVAAAKGSSTPGDQTDAAAKAAGTPTAASSS